MPQVIRTWRTRSTDDISAAWLLVALVAMAVWIAYGSLIDAPAVILVNVLSVFQCGSILFIKVQNLARGSGEARLTWRLWSGDDRSHRRRR